MILEKEGDDVRVDDEGIHPDTLGVVKLPGFNGRQEIFYPPFYSDHYGKPVIMDYPDTIW